VGKSKSAVSNTLRLLDLPDDIQKALEFGKMTEGHARALLMIEDPLHRRKVFALILEQKLSVRQAEDLARGNKTAEREAKPTKIRLEKPADIRSLETSLEQSLGTKVEIRTRKDPTRGGSLTIHFYSLDDFDKIVKVLKK
jgi:ParB family chromosome partitioning protein